MQTPARVCRRYTHGQYFKTTSRSLTQKLNSFITSSNFSDTFQLTQAQLKFNPNYGLLNALSSVHHVQCVNIILTSKCRQCRPSSSQGILEHYKFLYTIVTISYRNFMADSLIPSHSRRSLGRILFPAKTGVRQGCSLSLLLFIIVIDWVSRTAYSSSTGKQWTLASRF